MWPSLLLPLFIASALPPWVQDLKPETQMKIAWKERREKNRDFSGPLLTMRGGIFPKVTENFRFGLELSTATDPFSGDSSDELALAEGMTHKRIGISQAFASGNAAFGNFEWSLQIGKFENPLLYSPLLWDSSIRPEGLVQSLEWKISPKISAGIFAAQYSADQVTASLIDGTPLRRSWLFQQGVVALWHPSEETEIRGVFNQYYFFDPSERLARHSALLGNTLENPTDPLSNFREKYAPSEWIVEMSGRPLGIGTSLKGALAINFATSDKQRGFFVEGKIGNAWKKGSFIAGLSYYYLEPDLTVALFSSPSYGSANRKGPRAELNYFIFDFLRAGSSFLYGEVLTVTTSQADRKEFRFEMELKL